MKVCFMGHRSINKMLIHEKLEQVIKELIKNGNDKFIMGNHGDFDNLSLSICRKLKREFVHIKIEVVIGSLNPLTRKKNEDDFINPFRDVQTVFYDVEHVHFKRRLIEINKRMVNECDILVCYVDERKNYGGARLIKGYAEKKGLRIINLFGT